MKTKIGILTLLAMVTFSGLAFAQAGRWAADGEISSLTGTVVDDQRPVTTMTVDGEEVVLHLGPNWYWARMGYALAKGEQVEALGEIVQEDGVRHLYAHKLTIDDRVIELADAAGIPLWTRGARGHGRAPQATGAQLAGGRGRGGRGQACCASQGRGGRGHNQNRPARTCWRG